MPIARPLMLDSLEPVDHRGLHEAVLTQLLVAIRRGQLGPGERLREVEIAERLGLSRGTVREAIRRLEQEGLVVSQPHRGSYIAKVGVEDAAEIYSLRRVLEAFAVRLAIPRIDEAALGELTETVRAMVDAARSGDRNEHLRTDLKFHEQICLRGGHQYLHRVWSGLALKLWLVSFGLRDDTADDRSARAKAHFELVDILRRRDSDRAVAWIENHIDARKHQVIEQITRQSDPGGPSGTF